MLESDATSGQGGHGHHGQLNPVHRSAECATQAGGSRDTQDNAVCASRERGSSSQTRVRGSPCVADSSDRGLTSAPRQMAYLGEEQWEAVASWAGRGTEKNACVARWYRHDERRLGTTRNDQD
ncbi:hypothetical protein PybrP1_008317, partial [[Pythium] brassicae (nom. inval.)]